MQSRHNNAELTCIKQCSDALDVIKVARDLTISTVTLRAANKLPDALFREEAGAGRLEAEGDSNLCLFLKGYVPMPKQTTSQHPEVEP